MIRWQTSNYSTISKDQTELEAAQDLSWSTTWNSHVKDLDRPNLRLRCYKSWILPQWDIANIVLSAER